MQEAQDTRVQCLGQEDPLEEEMATHSSILAWRIPWTEEPGRLQSMGLQKSWTWFSDSTTPWLGRWVREGSRMSCPRVETFLRFQPSCLEGQDSELRPTWSQNSLCHLSAIPLGANYFTLVQLFLILRTIRICILELWWGLRWCLKILRAEFCFCSLQDNPW